MKNIIQKLSFIRYLYDFAIRQSYKQYPNSIVSLLLFHDAIEHFNIYALEYKVDIKKEIIYNKKGDPSFMEYFDILGLSSQKRSIQRLSEARKNLKHKGNWPSKIEIESFRASVTNFFEETTNYIFNIEFSEISLIDLISNDEVRELVKESEVLLRDKKIDDALIKISLGFAKLIRSVDIIICDPLPSMRISDFGIKNHNIDRYLDKFITTVNSIGEAMKCNVLGIDYQRYLKFREITPDVSFTLNGTPNISFGRNHANIEELGYCIDFVIESALSIEH